MPMPIAMPASRSNRIEVPTISDYLNPSRYGYLSRYYTSTISSWWNSMGPRAKRITIGLTSIYAALFIIAIYIGPEQLFDYTAQVAISLSKLSFGKPLIVFIIIVLSFPPLVGYGTAQSLCGLAYGAGEHSVIEGWLLASAACLAGSTVSFFTLRYLMTRWRDWELIRGVRDDKRWRAMEMAVRSRGMFMVILIRFCPFPFCYSNLFFASMESVNYFQFLISTGLITPKLLVHVFLGARMFELMDKESRKSMDGTGKFVNGLYVVVGSLVGILTSYYVYQKTQEMLKAYELEDQVDLDQEAGIHNGSDTPRHDRNHILFDTQNPDQEESLPFIQDDERRNHFKDQDLSLDGYWPSSNGNANANGNVESNTSKKKGLQRAWDR